VTLFLIFIIYFLTIKNDPQIEQFKENIAFKSKKSDSINEKLLSRIETLEGDFKELSALMGYTLESIDNRVKKNEEKLKKLSLRQRDVQDEIKEIQN
jgi:hypothetical protein